MTYWKHRTKKGRVVYDRKPNLFKWTDARRIVSSIPPIDLFSENWEKDYAALLNTSQICLAQIAAIALVEVELLPRRGADARNPFKGVFDELANITDKVVDFLTD